MPFKRCLSVLWIVSLDGWDTGVQRSQWIHHKLLSVWTMQRDPALENKKNNDFSNWSSLREIIIVIANQNYQKVNDVWSGDWTNVWHCWARAKRRVPNLRWEHFSCVQCDNGIYSADTKSSSHCEENHQTFALCNIHWLHADISNPTKAADRKIKQIAISKKVRIQKPAAN